MNRIVYDQPFAEYHERKLGVVSKSALDAIERSPAHYRQWLLDDGPSTKALEFGRAFHLAVLETEVYHGTYVVEPKFSGKGAKAAREEWQELNASKIPIAAEDHDAIMRMLGSVLVHPAASRILSAGKPEVSIHWQDEQGGLQCKARADYYVPERKLVADLKSTTDASVDEFAKSIARYGYHKQHALYADGFRMCGEPINHFVLIAVEKTPPHAVAVYTLDAEAVTKGYHAARQGIDMMAHCMKTGEWPAYSPGIVDISLPRWAA